VTSVAIEPRWRWYVRRIFGRTWASRDVTGNRTVVGDPSVTKRSTSKCDGIGVTFLAVLSRLCRNMRCRLRCRARRRTNRGIVTRIAANRCHLAVVKQRRGSPIQWRCRVAQAAVAASRYWHVSRRFSVRSFVSAVVATIAALR